MGIDNQNNISDEFADSELGGEYAIPSKYHVQPTEASVKGMPLHPVIEPTENEEEVLGIG